MDKIKNRLQKALITRGITPAELAQKSGINKGNISRYLSGKVEPKQSSIFAMAKVLDVSPSWLLGIDNDFTLKADESTLLIEKIGRLSPKDQDTINAIVDTLLDKAKESGDDNTKV